MKSTHNIVVPVLLAIQYADGIVETVRTQRKRDDVPQKRFTCDYRDCSMAYDEGKQLQYHKWDSHEGIPCCGKHLTTWRSYSRH